MSDAIHADESAPERLTWKQICERYPDEWVVLVDTEWANDTDFDFGTTIVFAHHKRRKDMSPDVKSAFERYESVGTYWTGKMRGPIPRFMIP